MKRSKKTPAPKNTKLTPRKGETTADAAPKDAAVTTTKAAKVPPERDARIPAVGTKIRRIYKGKDHEVTVEQEGFTYAGELFRSLSGLARRITGFAAVNGLTWFRLAEGRDAKPATKEKRPAAPTTAVDGIDLSTPAGQRAALAAAGITKKSKGAKPATKKAAKSS